VASSGGDQRVPPEGQQPDPVLNPSVDLIFFLPLLYLLVSRRNILELLLCVLLVVLNKVFD
jgi:energy-coupling factor transporter transmembrane protein EcfT